MIFFVFPISASSLASVSLKTSIFQLLISKISVVSKKTKSLFGVNFILLFSRNTNCVQVKMLIKAVSTTFSTTNCLIMAKMKRKACCFLRAGGETFLLFLLHVLFHLSTCPFLLLTSHTNSLMNVM